MSTLSLRNVRLVISIAACAASLAGCAAQVATETRVVDDSFDEDSKADGSAPLRRRVTWSNRLLACKVALDAAQDASTDDYARYTSCLGYANDSALGRIGLDLAANVFTTFEAGTGTPRFAFSEFRAASRAVCADVYSGAPTSARERMIALCNMDTEIDLATRIGEMVTFTDLYDANGNYIPFDAEQFLAAPSVSPASIAACLTSFGGPDGLDSLELEIQSDCVWEAAEAGAAATSVFARATSQHIEAMRRPADDLCYILGSSGEIDGGPPTQDAWHHCTRSEASRTAGYISQTTSLDSFVTE